MKTKDKLTGVQGEWISTLSGYGKIPNGWEEETTADGELIVDQPVSMARHVTEARKRVDATHAQLKAGNPERRVLVAMGKQVRRGGRIAFHRTGLAQYTYVHAGVKDGRMQIHLTNRVNLD